MKELIKGNFAFEAFICFLGSFENSCLEVHREPSPATFSIPS